MIWSLAHKESGLLAQRGFGPLNIVERNSANNAPARNAESTMIAPETRTLSYRARRVGVRSEIMCLWDGVEHANDDTLTR